MIDIAAIRARADFTPAGPWTVTFGSTSGGYPQRVVTTDAHLIAECFENPDYGSFVAEFLAAARSDIPALCAALEQIRALCDHAARFDKDASVSVVEVRAALAGRNPGRA